MTRLALVLSTRHLIESSPGGVLPVANGPDDAVGTQLARLAEEGWSTAWIWPYQSD